MDHALRVLREGPQQGSGAPLITLNDNLDILGGTELFDHALTELSSAILHQRAQATRLLLITTLRPPLDIYTTCCSSMTLGIHINILDAFTDKHGWIAKYTNNTSSSHSTTSSPPPSTKGITRFPFHHQQQQQQQQQLLDNIQSHLLSHQDLKHTALVIDSLIPLLDTLGIGLTCQLLHTLTSHVSCIFTSFHPDIHLYKEQQQQQQAIHALEAISYGCIELMNVRELEKDAVMALQQQRESNDNGNNNGNSNSSNLPPCGKLRLKLRRRLGRYKTESQLYSVDKDGKIELYGVPEGLPSVQTLIALNQSKKKNMKNKEKGREGSVEGGEQKNSSSNNRGSSSNTNGASSTIIPPSPMASSIVDATADQLAGGMKLSLTSEEEEARRRVQLPYEHRGEGGKWQTGDWKDYLPVTAGGRGGEVHSSDHHSGGLGRIMYVRDSDSSEPDSDEDPDDDLDI